MTSGTITIAISAVGLAITLMTVAFKLSKSISDSAVTNAASRAELTESNKALQKSLDDFKEVSRTEHAEFRKNLEEDSRMLAAQREQIKAHDKTLSAHEKRISKLEKEN